MRRPRRLFSALRHVALWARESGDIEGGQAAIDEAEALIEPDWAAEFRIVVLRFRAKSSRRAGEHDAAAAMYGEAIRLAREAGDWRLEVIERVNACDLLWELGRHDEAAQKLAEVLEALKRRPASDFELVETLTEQIGVLGESGRIDEAVAATRAALARDAVHAEVSLRAVRTAALAAGQAGGGGTGARGAGGTRARGARGAADQRGTDRGGDRGGAASDAVEGAAGCGDGTGAKA